MLQEITDHELNQYRQRLHRKDARTDTVTYFIQEQHQQNFNWRYFVTLTFHEPIHSPAQVHRICKKFYKNINQKLFGKRSRKALRCLFSIEHNDRWDYHVHLLVEDPIPRLSNTAQHQRCHDDLQFQIILRHAWNQIDQRTALPDISTGSTKGAFQKIHDVRGVLEYITKTHQQDAIQWDLYSRDGKRLPTI